MSRLRSDRIANKAGTGAPELTYGAVVPGTGTISGAGNINVTGVITATSFSKADGTEVGGAIVGIDTVGISTFNRLEVTSDATVGGALTVTGNLTVNGTQTIINTASLEVEDINIGIASATSRLNDTNLDGAGITIYGSDGDKTLTWDNSGSRMAFSTDVYAPRFYGDGSQLTGISAGGAGFTTAAHVANNAVVTLDLSAAADHKVTATGICTITCTGGTEAESHTIRIINSGSATVGFSTYFLFPSGATPVLTSTDGAINLISFTVNRVGAAGTQLLAGASLNFS